MEDLSFSTNTQDVEENFTEALPLGSEPYLQRSFSISSLFSPEYYKQFFNVTTDDIIDHVISATNPRDKKFLSSQSQPELYGPIWATITSIFFSMVCGNLSSWIAYGKEWKRSIGSVFTASTLCFLYTFVSPFVYRSLGKANNPPSLVSLMELFGYSCLLMVPVAAARLIVGKKIDFIISLAGNCVAGYSVLIKLSAFYNDEKANSKMKTINIGYAAFTILLFVFVQYLCFKN